MGVCVGRGPPPTVLPYLAIVITRRLWRQVIGVAIYRQGRLPLGHQCRRHQLRDSHLNGHDEHGEHVQQLLPDVCCPFVRAAGGVGARESRQSLSISLSGQLSSLHCLANGTKSRITVLSFNYWQLLDSAVVRSGHVDTCAQFALLTRADVASLVTFFYPDESSETAVEFGDAVFAASRNFVDRTMATLQQLFIKLRAAPAQSAACLVSSNEPDSDHFSYSAKQDLALLEQATVLLEQRLAFLIKIRRVLARRAKNLRQEK